jgi:hypothetical protein
MILFIYLGRHRDVYFLCGLQEDEDEGFRKFWWFLELVVPLATLLSHAQPF